MFVAEAVSVTLEVDRTGVLSWWITPESGVPPTCENLSACIGCRSVGEAVRRRGAYAVLKTCAFDGGNDGARCGRSLFAPLTRRSVLSLRRAARWVREQVLLGEDLVNVLRFVTEAFSKAIGCGGEKCSCRCLVHRKCLDCTALLGAGVDARFWRCNFFRGGRGAGNGLFGGVSDAIGDVEVNGGAAVVPWLSCPLSRNAKWKHRSRGK